MKNLYINNLIDWSTIHLFSITHIYYHKEIGALLYLYFSGLDADLPWRVCHTLITSSYELFHVDVLQWDDKTNKKSTERPSSWLYNEIDRFPILLKPFNTSTIAYEAILILKTLSVYSTDNILACSVPGFEMSERRETPGDVKYLR